jgi:hypothetical protein
MCLSRCFFDLAQTYKRIFVFFVWPSFQSRELITDNPEKFLKLGDHISISRSKGSYHHDAVYAGNRKVYHISPGDGDLKSVKPTTHAKFEDWEKFIKDKGELIRIVG